MKTSTISWKTSLKPWTQPDERLGIVDRLDLTVARDDGLLATLDDSGVCIRRTRPDGGIDRAIAEASHRSVHYGTTGSSRGAGRPGLR